MTTPIAQEELSSVDYKTNALLATLLGGLGANDFHAGNYEIGLGISVLIATGVGGWLFFTLFEYSMHRFFFHMKIGNAIKKRIQYTFHGVHHEYPNDKDRLAMPLPVSAGIAFSWFFWWTAYTAPI